MPNKPYPAEIVQHIVAAIAPLLQGFPPEIQGAALADLTAMWLAGHMGAPELREVLLFDHVELIRQLIEPNVQLIMERIQTEGSG